MRQGPRQPLVVKSKDKSKMDSSLEPSEGEKPCERLDFSLVRPLHIPDLENYYDTKSVLF